MQGDVTCDEDVNLDDVLALLRERAAIAHLAACLGVSGDVNCDGAVDQRDAFWLLLWIAGLGEAPPGDCVEIGSSLPTSEGETDVGLTVDPRQRADCGEVFVHVVTVAWTVTDPPGPVDVTAKALFSWGPEQSEQSDEPEGDAEFVEPDVGGGQVVVVVEVRADGTPPEDPPLTSAMEVLLLDSCVSPPPIPLPGVGYTDSDPGPPDLPLAGNPGPIREVDVVHVGGSPFGPTSDVEVVAVGTGAAWRLYSYMSGPAGPEDLQELGSFAGRNVKLLALTPRLSPMLTLNLLVVGYIYDGNLWLATFQLATDGTLTPLDKRGYGSNAGVIVREYDLAHRELPSGNFQVVTPLIGDMITPQSGGDDPAIRTATWSVNMDTGAVNGQQDSGPWGLPDEDSELSIAHLEGDSLGDQMYVVAYRSQADNMRSAYWNVNNAGFPSAAGSGASGLSLRGGSTVIEPMLHTDLAPLADGGFLSPNVQSSDPTLIVWETRLGACDGGCFFVPYRITDETLDQDSNLGVDLSSTYDPTLTDGSSANVQNGATQPVRAILTDALWETDFGVGDGEVYSEGPVLPVSVGVASVTKVMTLHLAVRAINDGDVSLDDVVEVSANAAGTGGSSMNLVEGEEQTLRNLMYGMMLVSGNDASVAIAEHVAGDEDDFVDLMNVRANQLDLNFTAYNQPAGGGYSTPQDQVTLWLEGYQDPLFRQFTNQKMWDACGETAEGDEICRFLVKFSDSGYPGLEGWKNGNIGFSTAEMNANNVPLCTSCLVAQATRLGRTFVTGIQQSGDRWGDSSDLFDFGYLSLFTPDRVEFASSQGVANDFGLDAIHDGLAITAQIDENDELQVCTWQVNADFGQIVKIGCSSPRIPNMLGGANVPRTYVDTARLSTLLREGDFITAYTVAAQLTLEIHQVATKEP